MAGLIPTFTITEALDNKSVALLDTTGVYHVTTNPNGYGVPGYHSGRAIADIQAAWIRITKPKGTTYYTTIVLSGATAQTLASGTAYTISMADLGGLSTDKMTDGVYTFEYIPVFVGYSGDIYSSLATSTTITFTSGNSTDFLNATYFQYNGTGTIFQVANKSTTTVTFTNVFGTTATSQAMDDSYIGYGVIIYKDVTGVINNCLAVKGAALALVDACCCEKKIQSCAASKLMTNITLFYAINLNMQLLEYNKAQKLIDHLTNYCNNNCNCGCS